MKRSILLATIFAAFSLSAAAQARTIINDAAAAKMLLGKHKLSLQWISWTSFGTVDITNEAEVYSVRGSQKGRSGGDLLTIEGMIVSIDRKQFIFEGTIVTQVSHINGGKPCSRYGDFTFKITGKRKYWRLQEMSNPCDTATDYVDIYFK